MSACDNGVTLLLLLNLAADLLNEADEANHSGHPATYDLQRQARAVLAEAIERQALAQSPAQSNVALSL